MPFQKHLKTDGFKEMKRGAELLLSGLSKIFPELDLQDENFLETPHRIAKLYVEMCYGLSAKNDIANIFSKSFPTTYNGIVTQTDIMCFSLCPHHFLPVKYSIDFGYIPKTRAIGLSKVSRFITVLAKKPVLQEDFTKEIITTFVDYVEPEGCIVIVRGIHNCIQCRGASQVNSACITSEIYGCFEDTSTRNEFFNAIQLNKR